MGERQPIGKKLRFEVFKRDKFTCQYCGDKAPDVILEVDHINPVAAGGPSDILNLVTSCKGCNAGKGARLLSDDSAVERQREQMEEIQERRAQLEMLVEWRDGLQSHKDDVFAVLQEQVESKTHLTLNEHGRGKLRKWISRFEVHEIMSAIDTAFEQYIEFDKDGLATSESFNVAFNKIPGIITVTRRSKDKPWLQDLYYIRGILRNRVRVSEGYVMALLEMAYDEGMDIEDMKIIAKNCYNWGAFQRDLHDFIDAARKAK